MQKRELIEKMFFLVNTFERYNARKILGFVKIIFKESIYLSSVYFFSGYIRPSQHTYSPQNLCVPYAATAKTFDHGELLFFGAEADVVIEKKW